MYCCCQIFSSLISSDDWMLKLIHAVITLRVLNFLTSCLGIKVFIFIFSIKEGSILPHR